MDITIVIRPSSDGSMLEAHQLVDRFLSEVPNRGHTLRTRINVGNEKDPEWALKATVAIPAARSRRG